MKKLILLAITAAFVPAAFAAGSDLNLGAMDDANEPAAETSTQASNTNDGCYQSDPRLASLGEVVKNIKSDNPPADPVKITSERLIKFNPKVLKMLGDHYVVVTPDCSQISVVGGELIQSVPVDFTALANSVASAVEKGDKDRLQSLASGFYAAPVDPVEGLSLAVLAPYNEETNKKIASVFNVKMRKERGSQEKTVLTMPDLFARLGGKITTAFALEKDRSGFRYKINDDAADPTTVDVLKTLYARESVAAMRNMGYQVSE